MNSNIFSSGEIIEDFKVKVLNENEVRAGAGVIFLFAIISFLNSWLVGNFIYTKIFVVAFLIEFIFRVLINPKYAPTLVLAKFITKGQKPVYTGAVQKRWAWSMGLALATLMFYLIVLNDIKGPVNLFTCLLCLTLLFFEAAFGICLGCKIYRFFNKDYINDCPSGNCEISKPEAIQKINLIQTTIFVLFLGFIYYLGTIFNSPISNSPIISESLSTLSQPKDDCTPPQWAIDIGHGEKWKLHHGCK